MAYIPMNFEKINIATGLQKPSSLKVRNTNAYAYWERTLFHRVLSCIDFELPIEGNARFFVLWCLFRYGYVGVFKTNNEGLLFQPCSLSGYDVYYQPTKMIVANPTINNGSLDLTIHENAELLMITPDYIGVWDVIDYYASKLALMTESMDVNIVNSKFSYILGAKTKAGAGMLKKVLDLVNQGEPAVVFRQVKGVGINGDESPFHQVDLGNPKDRYITDLQLKDFATIMNQFNTEIGIPSVPYEKKERMVTDEANSKNVESQARITTWVNTFNSCAEIVNAKFGTSISAKINFIDEEETGKEGDMNE